SGNEEKLMALLTPLNVNCHASDGRKIQDKYTGLCIKALYHHRETPTSAGSPESGFSSAALQQHV
ncbi:hypothetical protein XENOCAPTIV_019206, partial [Xenoophorus captivus]